ncbi:HAD family hydrolase [Ramlibacter solisilvae]|uniref:Haloacid dehalogenase n=1 Tax=Ramlibacter tataouinensis TaxID=94132 RepID=A0A127JT69_9BURK|nr:HAD-IB family hydrolase [Ramlibacter tataouinensis]AMO23147.1 haloacid dehalogenase [Ramlibacter tataouinensis]
MKPRLTLFDLDETLLAGDSDVLWCELLMARGLLNAADFGPRNADMETRYRASSVSAQEFAGFYLSLLTGRTPASLEPLRAEFLRDWVVPRIPPAALRLVQAHQAQGDLVVMTTATNRFITELTARHFGIEHLIAIEPEVAQGAFTGRSTGTLNMREGKVARLHDWLRGRGAALADFHSTAYSDSMNDLPLLEAVNEAVAVDPAPRLAAIAAARGWRVLGLRA